MASDRIAEALADAALLGMFYDCEPGMYPEGEAAFLADIRRDSFEHVITAENVARRVLAALRADPAPVAPVRGDGDLGASFDPSRDTAITLHAKRGDHGLWYVTSPQDKGLLIADAELHEALAGVVAAISDLAMARRPDPVPDSQQTEGQGDA